MTKCSGGLRTLVCFRYFLKMEAFQSELLTGHYKFIQLYKIRQKNILFFIFSMYQNYPLALS